MSLQALLVQHWAANLEFYSKIMNTNYILIFLAFYGPDYSYKSVIIWFQECLALDFLEIRNHCLFLEEGFRLSLDAMAFR